MSGLVASAGSRPTWSRGGEPPAGAGISIPQGEGNQTAAGLPLLTHGWQSK